MILLGLIPQFFEENIPGQVPIATSDRIAER
jgi:hypothetical protein